jgi:tol-pal system protein YbgF
MNRRISALLPILAALFMTFFVIGCTASGGATEETLPVRDTLVVAPASGPTRDELQQELDALKTDNIQMKEKLNAAERTNHDLLSKASDLEASIAAREQRAKAAAVVARSYEGATSRDDVRVYKAAVEMVRNGKFRESIASFEALLNTSVKKDYAPNCRHWMGLAYFGLRDYASALEEFNGVFEFPFSNKKDDAQLMIAQCYEKMGDLKQAKAEYEKLLKTYPASEYAERAKKKVGRL